MQQLDNLSNHLLIAMPKLNDSWFDGTVTYLCEHDSEGALGIVLNKPLSIGLKDICESLNICCRDNLDRPVIAGGPVNTDQGFILHRQTGHWDSTLSVHHEAHLTSSKDILVALADGRGPNDYRLTLGYAGWGAQQLENELKDNAWLTLEASSELLFDTPADALYQTALAKLGISPEFLSADAGHA